MTPCPFYKGVDCDLELGNHKLCTDCKGAEAYKGRKTKDTEPAAPPPAKVKAGKKGKDTPEPAAAQDVKPCHVCGKSEGKIFNSQKYGGPTCPRCMSNLSAKAAYAKKKGAGKLQKKTAKPAEPKVGKESAATPKTYLESPDPAMLGEPSQIPHLSHEHIFTRLLEGSSRRLILGIANVERITIAVDVEPGMKATDLGAILSAMPGEAVVR